MFSISAQILISNLTNSFGTNFVRLEFRAVRICSGTFCRMSLIKIADLLEAFLQKARHSSAWITSFHYFRVLQTLFKVYCHHHFQSKFMKYISFINYYEHIQRKHFFSVLLTNQLYLRDKQCGFLTYKKSKIYYIFYIKFENT